MDDAVLSLVADHDPLYQAEVEAISYSDSYEWAEQDESCDQRPATADLNEGEERPFTTTRLHEAGEQERDGVSLHHMKKKKRGHLCQCL